MQNRFDDVDQQLREMRRRMNALEQRVKELENKEFSFEKKPDVVANVKKTKSYVEVSVERNPNTWFIFRAGGSFPERSLLEDLGKRIPQSKIPRNIFVTFEGSSRPDFGDYARDLPNNEKRQNIIIVAVMKFNATQSVRGRVEELAVSRGFEHGLIIVITDNVREIIINHEMTAYTLNKLRFI